MKNINLDDIRQYVAENIAEFHSNKLNSLETLKLKKLLNKNPYLYKAKYIETAGDLVNGLLSAFLSSSEEKFFGDFLEKLAVFIATRTCRGHKSAAQGIDLEFFNNQRHYIVSVKSGPSWGNSSQQSKLEQDLRNGVIRIKQANPSTNVQPVLGICYGKTRTSYLRGYLKVVGQNFWYLISENKALYTDIIEPIGKNARHHNESFQIEMIRVTNRLTKQFLEQFCLSSGAIDWVKLVEFISGNYDL
ncbi:cytosolic protein, partial [candidate division KSB1 bacterium]|nr:cytosolic protein [candidate division KSB1 bacterium]